jgi:hypothetical protein
VSLATASTHRRWWWIRAFLLYALAVAATVIGCLVAPPSVIPVALGAVVLILYAIASTLGYRPLQPNERAFMERHELHHYSAAPYETLVGDGGTGYVNLDVALCRRTAIMIRSDRPWQRPRRAIYCFLGPAHASVVNHNVTSARQRTLIVIDGSRVQGPVLVRGDGALALPDGYNGPAHVHNLSGAASSWPG